MVLLGRETPTDAYMVPLMVLSHSAVESTAIQKLDALEKALDGA